MTHKNEQGFTLIEVLVSMVIFSIGILGVINMQILSTVTNVQSRGMTEGVIVAQNKIEELMEQAYLSNLLTDRTTGANVGSAGTAGLDDFPLTDTAVDNADHSDTVTNARFATFWNVAENTPFANAKTVRVIVRWNHKGVFRNFSIDAVRTKEFN